MKKIIAIAAVIAAIVGSAFATSSCTKQAGDFMYEVKVDFPDNFDVLKSKFDDAFKEAGCDKLSPTSSLWHLNGEKNACDAKVKKAFLAKAQDIDNNRGNYGLAGALALKGQKVTLEAQYGDEKYTLATYTFQKDDAKE